jgi:hypothetical protein
MLSKQYAPTSLRHLNENPIKKGVFGFREDSLITGWMIVGGLLNASRFLV